MMRKWTTPTPNIPELGVLQTIHALSFLSARPSFWNETLPPKYGATELELLGDLDGAGFRSLRFRIEEFRKG